MAKSRVVKTENDNVVDRATAPSTEEAVAPEQELPGIKTVSELMDVASQDERLAKEDSLESFIPEDKDNGVEDNESNAEVSSEQESEVKEIKVGRFDKEAIAKIIGTNDLSIMNKIEQIAKLLPQPSNKLALGLRGLFVQRANDSSNSIAINIEQKAFYRNFKELLRLPQNDFNEQYKYLNWIHKQLLDLELIHKEKLPIVAGVSPIHVMNVFLYCANKDDAELLSFVYLFTLLDMRVTDVDGALKGKSPDLSKVSVKKTLLKAEDVEKINKYYNAD